ncbi:MAG: sensor histidine kinase, partial [Pyrinomonadaceae bacterium]
LDEANARSLAVQAQLTSLESRIHPHFLFNTLNSIAALIKEDPVKAERMIERLSALLHYSLAMDTSHPVPLSEELRVTCEYLEIESVRYEEKLEFTVNSQNGIPSVVLPAFSLQTIVENVVKHVVAKSSAVTRIDIEIGTSEDKTIVRVKDNGPGFSVLNLKPGHGLDNLRNRLSNLKEPTASLKIVETGKGGVVELTIDAI